MARLSFTRMVTTADGISKVAFSLMSVAAQLGWLGLLGAG